MNSNHVDFSAIIANARKAREQASSSASSAVSPSVKSATITCKPQPKVMAAKAPQASEPVSEPAKVSFTREECMSFIIKMRDARDIEEKILVLKGFSGYDSSLPLGLQIDNASLMAKAIVSPAAPKLFRRGASATLAGYIAGTPNPVSKIRDNLLARLELSYHELADAQWLKDNARCARELKNIKAMQKELDNLAG